MKGFFILIGLALAKNWRDFVDEDYSAIKLAFEVAEMPEIEGFQRQSRQEQNLVPDKGQVDKELDDLVKLYGMGVQELRDASFGPLTTGTSDIEQIVDSIENFSKAGSLLYRGKKYVALLETMRRSYTYFPRNFLDMLSSMHDYEDLMERSKDEIMGLIQGLISYAENVPWTVKMMCNEHRMHHINHFINNLSILAQDGLEATLRLSHTFMQIQESVRRYESEARRTIAVPQLRIDMMDELSENITLNNGDIDEVLRWYEKSSRFYDNKIEIARAELVKLVQSLTTDDEPGDMVISHILYSIRMSVEKLNQVKLNLSKVATALTKSRRHKGSKTADLFPAKPDWLTLSQLSRAIMLHRNTSDEQQLEILSRIDKIKMIKRMSIQGRRRCFYARTKESLGDYWVPRHGPRCTSHINPDHIRIPLRDCHPEHLQSNFKDNEAKLVTELGELIRKLGTLRWETSRLIPAEYPSLESMLDQIGKKKRHSLAQASLNSRLLPESDNDARLMETIRGIFEHREDYDFAILDGILDELPSNINDGDVIGDLVNLYQNKTVAYKKIIKRANYLFMKGRSLFHQIYLDQRDLFQQQDSLSESINRAFDQELLLDLSLDALSSFRRSADYYTRHVEKIVRYWEKRVAHFQDVTRQMCAGFYPRTLSHIGRLPCIVKAICNQRDDVSGSNLNCLLQDQWVEAKETFEAVQSIMLLQPNKGSPDKRRGKRDLNEHFNLDHIEIDRLTYNYVKNVTERCIIPEAELEMTNRVCHNVFVCQDEKCALPVPDNQVTNRVCHKFDLQQCKIADTDAISNAITNNGYVFINYSLKIN